MWEIGSGLFKARPKIEGGLLVKAIFRVCLILASVLSLAAPASAQEGLVLSNDLVGQLIRDPAEAEAWADKAMRDAKPGARADITLYRAIAQARQSIDRRRTAKAVERLLKARAEAGEPDTLRTVLGWLTVSASALVREAWRDLAQIGAQAVLAAEQGTPQDINVRGLLFAQFGIGVLRTPSPSFNDVLRAREIFRTGAALFPKQTDVDDVPDILAQLVTWEATADALLKTLDLKRAERVLAETPERSGRLPSKREGLACDIEFIERPQPTYPKAALRKGYIGAVIIAYDLAKDGRVVNARTLAEVPNATFAPYILETMPSWRAKIAPNTPDACLSDILTRFEFVIR